MNRVCILAILLTTACGGSSAEVEAVESTGDSVAVETAGGSTAEWPIFEFEQHGISLAVPDPDACSVDEDAEEAIGHLECDYGDLQVEVFSLQGAEPTEELRAMAVDYTEIPGDLWEFQQAVMDGDNGYRWSEAWSATLNDTQACVGLLGQHGSRDISHIAFVCGALDAFDEHGERIAVFIENISAI